MSAQRNHTVDVVRLFSVAVVVVFHGFIYQAAKTPSGIEMVQWAPPRWVFWLSWVLMSMPAFFVCGGFANALIVDKMRERGTGFAHYLANRGRRLTGGLAMFVAVFAVVFTVLALVWDVDAAMRLSAELMFLLWFLSVYLVIVLFAPVLVRLHDRFGAWVLVVLAVGIIIVDRQIFSTGPDPVGQFNMLLVWPFCHQLGIGYERGWFRTGPVWRTWASLGGGVATIVVLIWHFGYPESAVGFANMPLANHIPPTLAMAALGLAQAAGMGLVDRWGVLANLPPRLGAFVARVNAVMMTVYLWHVPCIVAGGAALLAISLAAPAWSSLLLSKPMIVAAGMAVVWFVVPWLAWVEYTLIPPLGVRQDRTWALIAFALMIVGSMLVWHHGTVIHPKSLPATFGVFAILAGQVVMARASRPAGVTRDDADSLKPRRRPKRETPAPPEGDAGV